jgi:hypothetical protein
MYTEGLLNSVFFTMINLSLILLFFKFTGLIIYVFSSLCSHRYQVLMHYFLSSSYFFFVYISLVYAVMSSRKSLSWLGCICTVCMYNELADKEANKIILVTRAVGFTATWLDFICDIFGFLIRFLFIIYYSTIF